MTDVQEGGWAKWLSDCWKVPYLTEFSLWWQRLFCDGRLISVNKCDNRNENNSHRLKWNSPQKPKMPTNQNGPIKTQLNPIKNGLLRLITQSSTKSWWKLVNVIRLLSVTAKQNDIFLCVCHSSCSVCCLPSRGYQLFSCDTHGALFCISICYLVM